MPRQQISIPEARTLDELRAIHAWYAQHMQKRYNMGAQAAKAVTKMRSPYLEELLTLLPRFHRPNEVADYLDQTLLSMRQGLVDPDYGITGVPPWEYMGEGVERYAVGRRRPPKRLVLKIPTEEVNPRRRRWENFQGVGQMSAEIEALEKYGGRTYKVEPRQGQVFRATYPTLVYAPKHHGYIAVQRFRPTPYHYQHYDEEAARNIGDILGIDDMKAANAFQLSPRRFALIDVGHQDYNDYTGMPRKTAKGASKKILRWKN